MAKDRVNSRAKGSKNERELAKLFKDWTGYDFARVPSSGGLRWGRTSDTVGDLICSDKKHNRYFRFTIEAKNHKDINFSHLLLPTKNTKIHEFWDQAKEDSIRANKIPLLFMRYNGMPKNFHFVVMDIRTAKGLKIKIPEGNFLVSSSNGYELLITTSVELFKIDYNKLHIRAKKYLKALKN